MLIFLREEKICDPEVITAGKSHLALSERGWSSLRRVGVDDEVKNSHTHVQENYGRLMEI